MLIGLYLYMPFFSLWVERATLRQKQLFLAIWAVTLFLPYAYTFFTPELFGLCAWNGFGTFYYSHCEFFCISCAISRKIVFLSNAIEGMLSKGMDMNTIASILGLTEDEVMNYLSSK